VWFAIEKRDAMELNTLEMVKDFLADLGIAARAHRPCRRRRSWGTALGGLMAFERGYRDFWQHDRPLQVISQR
jgi:hypothetical protein